MHLVLIIILFITFIVKKLSSTAVKKVDRKGINCNRVIKELLQSVILI